MPAEKLPPAPVRIAQVSESSRLSSSHASAIWANIVIVIALYRCGRFIVTIRTPPSRSTSMCGTGAPLVRSTGGPQPARIWRPPQTAGISHGGISNQGDPMKFWASTSFSPPEHYVPLAKAADDAGVHGILCSDHIFYPRDLATPYPYSSDGSPIWPPDTAWPDNWVAIGAMAAVTERLEFGNAVYIAPARDLFTVAKAVGTAAVFSQNRVHLGVGAGWMREEFDQTGQEYTTRGKRLD